MVESEKVFEQGGIPMLVLTRKVGEQIVVGDNIRVTVVAANGQRVRLGIEAPPDVVIRRKELCFELCEEPGSVPATH
jgi:carbon storage regulator